MSSKITLQTYFITVWDSNVCCDILYQSFFIHEFSLLWAHSFQDSVTSNTNFCVTFFRIKFILSFSWQSTCFKFSKPPILSLYASHNCHGKFELKVTPNLWQANRGIHKLCHINQCFSWQQWTDTWHITDKESWLSHYYHIGATEIIIQWHVSISQNIALMDFNALCQHLNGLLLHVEWLFKWPVVTCGVAI